MTLWPYASYFPEQTVVSCGPAGPSLPVPVLSLRLCMTLPDLCPNLKTIYHKPLSLDLQILGCLSSTASFWDAGKSIKVVFLKNLQNKNLLLLLLLLLLWLLLLLLCVRGGTHSCLSAHEASEDNFREPDFPSTALWIQGLSSGSQFISQVLLYTKPPPPFLSLLC